MSRRVSHFTGRLLTGLTFGKRGGPVYARLYDKTREADAEALIRERWQNALGGPLSADARVWRIEFELRPEFLRTLADQDGEHIPIDPRELLADHLDGIWHHLTANWLVLRDARSSKRIARCAVQPWWQRLSTARTLGRVDGAPPELQRKRRGNADPEPLLRQLAGLLAAFGARREDQSLEGCLKALEDHLRGGGQGEERFAAAVERARLRMPLAAKTREAAERVLMVDPPQPGSECWLEAA